MRIPRSVKMAPDAFAAVRLGVPVGVGLPTIPIGGLTVGGSAA
jgi:hypothetical protein